MALISLKPLGENVYCKLNLLIYNSLIEHCVVVARVAPSQSVAQLSYKLLLVQTFCSGVLIKILVAPPGTTCKNRFWNTFVSSWPSKLWQIIYAFTLLSVKQTWKRMNTSQFDQILLHECPNILKMEGNLIYFFIFYLCQHFTELSFSFC